MLAGCCSWSHDQFHKKFCAVTSEFVIVTVREAGVNDAHEPKEHSSGVIV